MKTTRNQKDKTTGALLIVSGTITVMLMAKVGLDMAAILTRLLIQIPASLWTEKHTFIALATIITGGFTLYAGFRLGFIGIKWGINKLKKSRLDEELEEVSKEMKK